MAKILLIAERFPPDLGGLATSAARISESIYQLGVTIDVLVWSRYLQPGQIVTESGQSRIYRVGLYRNWDMTMIHTLNFLEYLVQKNYYKAIWGHYLFPAGFLAVWFGKLQGITTIVSARGNDVDRGVFPPGDFARLQWTLQQADILTSASLDLARKISLVAARNDVIAIKNAVNTETFSPSASRETLSALRHKLGIKPEEIILGFSGELREKKGQNFLLQTLAQVREYYPACLLIIGDVRRPQDGLLEVYSQQQPEAEGRIIITGNLEQPEQVAQHLQLCDLFLLPSVWEGLPNALLEAMACQCCCLASDAGGIPEIIHHGINGFILPRQQLPHLGAAVLEFLQLPSELKQKIGKAARDRILDRFSLETERSCLQKILKNIGISC
jgi:glycosyltransferase involved in cell wall biosynthesis